MGLSNARLSCAGISRRLFILRQYSPRQHAHCCFRVRNAQLAVVMNPSPIIFSHVFEEVQANAEEIWRYQMYFVFNEFDEKPFLPPPFIVIEHAWRLIKEAFRRLCVKPPSKIAADTLSDADIRVGGLIGGIQKSLTSWGVEPSTF
jgi:hypothetical protein